MNFKYLLAAVNSVVAVMITAVTESNEPLKFEIFAESFNVLRIGWCVQRHPWQRLPLKICVATSAKDVVVHTSKRTPRLHLVLKSLGLDIAFVLLCEYKPVDTDLLLQSA